MILIQRILAFLRHFLVGETLTLMLKEFLEPLLGRKVLQEQEPWWYGWKHYLAMAILNLRI
jgi:hypothetical protein